MTTTTTKNKAKRAARAKAKPPATPKPLKQKHTKTEHTYVSHSLFDENLHNTLKKIESEHAVAIVKRNGIHRSSEVRGYNDPNLNNSGDWLRHVISKCFDDDVAYGVYQRKSTNEISIIHRDENGDIKMKSQGFLKEALEIASENEATVSTIPW